MYRVLEPHLVSSYVYHADATDPLTDTPTVRLLRQLAAMGQSHVAWGQAVLDSLTQEPGEAPPRAGGPGGYSRRGWSTAAASPGRESNPIG